VYGFINSDRGKVGGGAGFGWIGYNTGTGGKDGGGGK